MINLRPNGLTTKWFIWCCDHLPLTVTRDYSNEKKEMGVRRTGAYYVENGTTLCHIVWAILWAPMMIAILGALFLCAILLIHIGSYEKYSPEYGIAGAFVPEAFIVGVALCVALLVFSLIGADKLGLGKLVWAYLKSIKSRVCPLVRFEEKP